MNAPHRDSGFFTEELASRDPEIAKAIGQYGSSACSVLKRPMANSAHRAPGGSLCWIVPERRR